MVILVFWYPMVVGQRHRSRLCYARVHTRTNQESLKDCWIFSQWLINRLVCARPSFRIVTSLCSCPSLASVHTLDSCSKNLQIVLTEIVGGYWQLWPGNSVQSNDRLTVAVAICLLFTCICTSSDYLWLGIGDWSCTQSACIQGWSSVLNR